MSWYTAGLQVKNFMGVEIHRRVKVEEVYGIMVGHGTLPGYRLKNLMCVMVHCRVTG